MKRFVLIAMLAFACIGNAMSSAHFRNETSDIAISMEDSSITYNGELLEIVEVAVRTSAEERTYVFKCISEDLRMVVVYVIRHDNGTYTIRKRRYKN